MVVAGGLTFAIYSVGSTSQAMFMREMKFRSIELRNWLALVVGGVIAITAAASGAGAWALVLQQVVLHDHPRRRPLVARRLAPARWSSRARCSRELGSFAIRIAGGRWARLIELWSSRC